MKIDIGFAATVVLCFALLLFLVNTLRENRRMMYSRKAKAQVIKCEICAYVFFVSSKIAYARCPVCSSINKIR